MDREQRIAFINAQIVCAQADIAGMQAENQMRMDRGLTIAYDHNAFLEVPERYGITHNQVIEYLRDF